MTSHELNLRFGINHELAFVEGPGGLVFADIDNGLGTARLCLQGAHLVSFQPADQPVPLIWVSEYASFGPGKSIRGGVPVCWPWFGPHATEPGYPGHGFARTVMWEVVSTAKMPSGATGITLSLIANDLTRAQWPHDTSVELSVTVGRNLELSLATTNNGPTQVELGEALHTYFQIGDIEQVQITGLDNTGYLDKVGEHCRRTQEGSIRFSGETDRVFVDTEAVCTIVDDQLKRRIVIRKTGSRSTVVWTPWTEKANKMGDFGKDGWRRMVCVETANALENCVVLEPGETHRMTAEYSAEAR
ncbi:MAG: D-hexose-6-phosphate mutarotase [Spirochaetia bacterium]|jgi:D-hexose-6-phosphate mutarotase|nr:D-hexose-6-phosphate mutarotase [Spirochaetia bacterium]